MFGGDDGRSFLAIVGARSRREAGFVPGVWVVSFLVSEDEGE